MYHDQDYQDDQVLISTHYISQYFTHHFLCENRRDHREDAEPRISEVPASWFPAVAGRPMDPMVEVSSSKGAAHVCRAFDV